MLDACTHVLSEAVATDFVEHLPRILRIEHSVYGKGPYETMSCVEGTEDEDRFEACAEAGHDIFEHYSAPDKLNGAIGKFFQAARRRYRALPDSDSDTMTPEVAPWFFGILETEPKALDPEACAVLDRNGFVLRTYIPAPGAFLVEAGQVAFIKSLATCVQEASIEATLADATACARVMVMVHTYMPIDPPVLTHTRHEGWDLVCSGAPRQQHVGHEWVVVGVASRQDVARGKAFLRSHYVQPYIDHIRRPGPEALLKYSTWELLWDGELTCPETARMRACGVSAGAPAFGAGGAGPWCPIWTPQAAQDRRNKPVPTTNCPARRNLEWYTPNLADWFFGNPTSRLTRVYSPDEISWINKKFHAYQARMASILPS